MCSAPSIAVWLLFAAIVLSIVAVSVSSWSYSWTSHDTSFTAGVWGFCVDVARAPLNSTDITASPPPPSIVTKCFPFHSASDGIVVNQTSFVEATESVCSLDRNGHTFRNLVALTPDARTTRVYIEHSCGSLGWASLILAALVPGLSAIALAFLAGFYYAGYYRPKWYLLVFATVFTGFAFVSSIAAFILWSIQAPSGLAFGAPYYLELATFVVLFLAMAATMYGCRVLGDQDHHYDGGRRDATMATYEHHLASPHGSPRTIEVK
ncbi:hypothetical protein DYB37_004630 [Aphanomyces astaci]|uniref:Uncharacterized protein n=1 Tax=Aphanomyces astaci TaxID=112090 RepID=A0A3R6XLS8_APHAT|nr:hypothetical protein DYB37_004630 [Aphanomyces astaci]